MIANGHEPVPLDRPSVRVFMMDWQRNNSQAPAELLLNPLKRFCDFKVATWDARTHSATVDRDVAEGIRHFIYCHMPPPSWHPWADGTSVSWLPMWDQVVDNGPAWWQAIPTGVRVVAFSKDVQRSAEHAGLECISLRYFPDVGERVVFDDIGTRRLLYWNRRGLLSPALLARLCRELSVSELIFRPTMDPGADKALEYLPTGASFPRKVTVIEGSLPRGEWMKQLSRAQLFVAPRALEGVGVTTLEAMARGAVVIALDAPTMNEYIEHERTGLFIRKAEGRGRALNALRTVVGERRSTYLASDEQDLSWAKGIDLNAIGSAAVEQTRKGAKSWRASWASYAEFILAD